MGKFAIFRALGIALLILGGLSGAVLFFKATTGTLHDSSSSLATLWGLFLIGLIAGIIMIAVT